MANSTTEIMEKVRESHGHAKLRQILSEQKTFDLVDHQELLEAGTFDLDTTDIQHLISLVCDTDERLTYKLARLLVQQNRLG